MTAPLDSLPAGEHERGRIASVVVPLRPSSLNAERSSNWRSRHHATAAWRQMSNLVATGRTEHGPRVARFTPPVEIVATPVQKGRLPDAGNCYPSVKAAIDGLVDAGLLPDDSPPYVHAVTLRAPRRPTPQEIEHLRLDIYPANTSETG